MSAVPISACCWATCWRWRILLTRLRSIPALAGSNTLPEAERTRGAALAAGLSIPWLGRLWQMLLKGVAEVDAAPERRAAAEMVLIRLCHVADLPTPGELVKKLSESGAPAAGGNGGGNGNNNGGGGLRAAGTLTVASGAVAAAMPATAPATAPAPAPVAPPRAWTFTDAVALAGAKRDVMLYSQLRHCVHLVKFAPPVIELRLEPNTPRDLPARLAALMEAETNRRWTVVAVTHAQGEPTLDEAETAATQQTRQSAEAHPLVQAILATFPGAKIEALAPAQPAEPEPPPDWADFTPPDELYEGDNE